MTVTAKCTPKYFVSLSGLVKYLQIGLAIVVCIFASMPLCYPSYNEANQELCQSVFDSESDAHGQPFVVVVSAIMAGATFIFFLIRLMDINNIEYPTNWRSWELFFNGFCFAVFALFGALEIWYATGYFQGTDYISTLNIKTSWIVAAACSFAHAAISILAMACAGFYSKKD